MGKNNSYLGELEELVLLAILRLRDDAYGARVYGEIADTAGRSITTGALYTVLDRLEQKGYVRSWQGDPSPERGGRPKRYFKIEGTGMRVLRETQNARFRLMDGLGSGFKPTGELI